MIEMTQGDMFARPVDIRVNTVNCVGIMGAGVALAFKQRYPAMYEEYRLACKRGEVRPGRIMEWRELGGDWVVNFPTKRDWRDPSRYEDIEAGLDAFRNFLKPLGSVTVALPALGCGHGGLDWKRVSMMIQEKLVGLDANIQVYEPQDSRAAGSSLRHSALEDNIHEVKKLGFDRKSIGDTELFAGGSAKALNTANWIAIFASREPTERELGALEAVASAIASQAPATVPALVHQGKASEKIALLFIQAGLDVLLLAPMGILTRKALTKLPSAKLSVAALGTPHEKWSRTLFARAVTLLRKQSSAVLVSDPTPKWLIERPDQWRAKSISFVEYEQMSEEIRSGLRLLDAQPVRRRASDGQPNVAALLNMPGQTGNEASLSTNSVNSTEEVILSVDLADFQAEEREAVLTLLSNASPQQWKMKISFSDENLAAAVEESLDRLRQRSNNRKHISKDNHNSLNNSLCEHFKDTEHDIVDKTNDINISADRAHS